jgi:hypothetical protein
MARAHHFLLLCLVAVAAAAIPARAEQQQQPQAAPAAAAAAAAAAAGEAPPPPTCPLRRPTARPAGNNPGKVAHAFTPLQAEEFIANQPPPRVLNHLTTTFDCVDSRSPASDDGGAHGHLGTAGGDAAELAAAIAMYCKLTGSECSFSLVQRIFERFMNEVATAARPFYLHQAESKLQKVLDDVAASGLVSERPPSLPAVAPEDEQLREVYLHSLVEGSHQGKTGVFFFVGWGLFFLAPFPSTLTPPARKKPEKKPRKKKTTGCGHLRLMIDRFAEYGLDSADVPQKLIRAFYLYWWPTPPGSAQRAKVEFPLLQGELHGSAVLVVGAAAETGACSHHSPAVAHASWGGQAFVYNAAAVDDFRARVLTPFFGRVAAAEEAEGGGAKALPPSFYAELSALQAKQLASTLTHLETAKDSPRLAVSFY